MRTSLRPIVLVALAACGGSNASPVPVTDLGTDLGKIVCQKAFACCTDAELMQQLKDITFNNQPITTEAECEQAFASLGAFLSQTYQTSINEGRITYDATAAGDCLATIRAMSCPDYAAHQHDSSPTEEGCMQFAIPNVDVGGACSQDYECKTNNCQFGSSGNDGVCQDMPTQGQACSGNCAQGLYCDLDPVSGMDVCMTNKADGAACTFNNQCSSGNCAKPGGTGDGTCASPACSGR
jgi:hypothetical protein